MAHNEQVREAKQSLRRELRAARRAIDRASLARIAEALLSRAAEVEMLHAARAVAGYVADDGELDIGPLLRSLRAEGAAILLPRSRQGGGIALALVDERTTLRRAGPAGILEPEATPADLEEVAAPALALVPCVALDRDGNRLGRGGGAYDRLIPELRGRGWAILGVCHSGHVLERIPVEIHDQSVDGVLTELGLTWARVDLT